MINRPHSRSSQTLSDTAAVEIEAPEARYPCAAFWAVRNGLLHDGAEYRATVGGESPDPTGRPS